MTLQEAVDYAAMTKEAKTDFLTRLGFSALTVLDLVAALNRLIQEAARFFKAADSALGN